MRLTLGQVRNTMIPKVLNLCDNDSSGLLAKYLNEAVMRLLPKGKWRGTLARYKFCTAEACITLPRQIESVEAFAICRDPGMIRSQWYEFMDYGPGQIKYDDCGPDMLVDRGLACAFDDIVTTGSKIRVYCDLAADVGKTILLQGWNSDANWVLTNTSADACTAGTVRNGELVTLAMPYVETTTTWLKGGLAAVQKDTTCGPVRLYESPVSGAIRPLAIYEPDETLPEYRRYMIPGIATRAQCCNTTDASCEKKWVTVLGKLAFVPVSKDTDFLLIGNIPALKDMVMSIKKREDNLIQEAVAYEMSAVRLLEEELSNYYGDGTVDPIRSINANVVAPAGVTSLI